MRRWFVAVTGGLWLLSAAVGEVGAAVSDAARDVATLQVLLDRVHFSPGSIDGVSGGVESRTGRTLRTFQQAYGLPVTGEPDEATWTLLKRLAPVPPFATYEITPADAEREFSDMGGEGWLQMAGAKNLGYTSIVELLGEKFHTSPVFLKKLNPKARFEAGERIVVPNVEPTDIFDFCQPKGEEEMEAEYDSRPAVRLYVSAAQKALVVADTKGGVLFYAPITPGSQERPLPSGEVRVEGVSRNPEYTLDPQRIPEARVDKKMTIAPGPNNPVGAVWIELSAAHYGIHGTPNPEKIGYSASHGCVRLTNWDAVRLAKIIKPGTKIEFAP